MPLAAPPVSPAHPRTRAGKIHTDVMLHASCTVRGTEKGCNGKGHKQCRECQELKVKASCVSALTCLLFSASVDTQDEVAAGCCCCSFGGGQMCQRLPGRHGVPRLEAEVW